MAVRTKASDAKLAEDLAKLREWIKPGDTVYTILRHVSRSGMMRHISVLIQDKDGGAPFEVSGWVARVLDYRRDDHDGGLKVGGAGMDMGYHLVHSLGYALYPAGFTCVGNETDEANSRRIRWCPSNDHSNGDRDYTPHAHQSGGYSLRHEWL